MHMFYSNELHPGMHGPVAYILTLVKWQGNIPKQKPFKWRPRGISIKRFCEISCFALKLHRLLDPNLMFVDHAMKW